jgi:transcriptional regulator with XRE-family HTH domain
MEGMIDRIKQIIEYYKLSPASFAEQIGINRSNLTHLFSGRNQPSLDLAKKILHNYPEIKTEWLIMGVGEMMRGEAEKELDNKIKNERKIYEEENAPDLFSVQQTHNATPVESAVAYPDKVSGQISDSREVEKIMPQIEQKDLNPSYLPSYPAPSLASISKIIFFYSDNSFEIYNPKKINS